MGLRLRDVPIQLSPEGEGREHLDAILHSATVTESAKAFLSLPVRPVRHCPEEAVLCVLQREFAVVSLSKVDVVGTDDCSNELMLFARLGSFVGCGHFDYGEGLIGSENCGVRALIEQLEEKTDAAEGDQIDVWIVGGFLDDNQNSGFMLGRMLAALKAEARPINIQLICSESLNDRVVDNIHYPIVVGAAFVKSEGTVVPAAFTHLGPGIGLRAALPCNGKEQMYSCYDTEADEICIQFEYSAFDMVEALVDAPDEFYLENLAGCPKQEAPRFCSTLRAGLAFLAEFPECEEVFENGPIRFSRSPVGAWVKKNK